MKIFVLSQPQVVSVVRSCRACDHAMDTCAKQVGARAVSAEASGCQSASISDHGIHKPVCSVVVNGTRKSFFPEAEVVPLPQYLLDC